jgi:hypothetical protein
MVGVSGLIRGRIEVKAQQMLELDTRNCRVMTCVSESYPPKYLMYGTPYHWR